MRTRKRCKVDGCENYRAPGRGCSYCTEHQLEAKRKRDRLKRRRQRKREAEEDARNRNVAADQDLTFKIRFLLGRA